MNGSKVDRTSLSRAISAPALPGTDEYEIEFPEDPADSSSSSDESSDSELLLRHAASDADCQAKRLPKLTRSCEHRAHPRFQGRRATMEPLRSQRSMQHSLSQLKRRNSSSNMNMKSKIARARHFFRHLKAGQSIQVKHVDKRHLRKISLSRSFSSPMVDGSPAPDSLSSRHVQFEASLRFSSKVEVRREYEDISHLLSERHKHLSSDVLNRMFGVTTDELSAHFRGKHINRKLEERLASHPLQQIKRRVLPGPPPAPSPTSSEGNAEPRDTDTPTAKKTPRKRVTFNETKVADLTAAAQNYKPPSDERRRQLKRSGSILKHTKMETWEEAVLRVYRERQAQSQKLLEVMSEGAFLTRIHPNGQTETVYVMVSPDGEELAWGKNQKSVCKEISGEKSFFQWGSSKHTQLRCLADVESMHFGYGVDPSLYRHYRRNNGHDYLCFSLTFQDKLTLHLACPTTHAVSTWFLGIQSLIPMSHSYLTHGKFLWRLARMKLIDAARVSHNPPGLCTRMPFKAQKTWTCPRCQRLSLIKLREVSGLASAPHAPPTLF